MKQQQETHKKFLNFSYNFLCSLHLPIEELTTKKKLKTDFYMKKKVYFYAITIF